MKFKRSYFRRWWEQRSNLISDLKNPQQWLMDLFGIGKTASGEQVTSETAMMNSNVYTCASILGGDIGKLPIQVFRRRGGGIERDTSHPVSKLLGVRSNPYMSAYTFKELMQVHMVCWGNAYANIEWHEDGPFNGMPKALWPLDPSKTDVHLDPITGEVWYVTTLPSGERRKLRHYEVLHYKAISKGGLKGITPIAVIREEIGVQQAQRKFLGAFYANGTATRGILKVPGATLDKPAKDKARDEWQKANSGLSNAHRIAILDAGMEYQSLGMPLNDAQFIETSKFGIMEVAKIYKVPGYKLGITDVKFNNMENQSLEYVKSTLQPIIVNCEMENDFKLFTEMERKKYYTKFNVTSELRGDSTSRAQFYKEMIAMGAYTINEVRELEERDNIGEMGDKHFVSLNFVSLDKMDQYQLLKAGLGKDATKGGGSSE
ncbi:phage portal protein [Paenibacillus sp. OV219]|uniref:phage portal protein n=1 Tax=Paenibacillus sp. OV219 TaxID=1884377 RepID=UPI0008C161C4|nr:phage portal protein [Paenibacillus sp. OV219]SEM81476.1 phage portal protein, HK97 family [Paenibacillus sp. OV219]